MPAPWCSRWPSCRRMKRPMPRCWSASPTGATASRRWSLWIRRTACCWTSPARRICSAAKPRCWPRCTQQIAGQGFAVRGAIAGTSLAARALARYAPGTIALPGGEAEADRAAFHHRLGLRRQDPARPAPCRPENHRHGGGARGTANWRNGWARAFVTRLNVMLGAEEQPLAAAPPSARPDGRTAFRRTDRHAKTSSPPRC